VGLRLPRSTLFPYTTLFRSNVAFRRLCREFGAGRYICEMVTTVALVERNPKTLRLIAFDPEERPRSLQLYGVDPEMTARAVHRRSEEHTSELQSRENLVCRL